MAFFFFINAIQTVLFTKPSSYLPDRLTFISICYSSCVATRKILGLSRLAHLTILKIWNQIKNPVRLFQFKSNPVTFYDLIILKLQNERWVQLQSGLRDETRNESHFISPSPKNDDIFMEISRPNFFFVFSWLLPV